MNTHKLDVLPYKIERINGDTLTPIGIFKNLTGQKKFLLESSFEHEKKGKYSYIGSDPYEEIIGNGNKTTIINYDTGITTTLDQHAFTYIKENLPKLNIDLPLPFSGGAIGYTGYDTIRQFENVGEDLQDELNMPDLHFMVYKNIIAYEHSCETAYLIAMNVDGQEEKVLDQRLEALKDTLYREITIDEPEQTSVDFTSNITKEDFIQKVKIAQQQIQNGDVLQVVLSQRMQTQINGDPFSFYRKLRTANPSPYMFYIDFDDYLIIGASPESLIQTSGDNIVTNPIAGTRARGKSADEDKQLEKELLADKKELTEHDMLVDLSKHDLERICDMKSITVPTYMKIEKYEHVMHIVSEVHGTLKEGLSSIDALIACLPAGTVSGAPKARAMKIINQLEEVKRGFYGGGIGYITFNHDLNMALAIRSLVVKDNQAYLQSGAGIVQDSIPEKEYEETLQKAKSLIQANDHHQLILG